MNLFNEIYDLTYLPLLTPANLIENLNLDNFKNINYSKNEIGIMAEVICEINKSMMKFYYQFDSKNFINTIYYYENNEIEFMFDRKKMLSDLRSEFSNLEAL